MITYFNGEFMSKEAVKISPDDRGFLLADGVYEVIRAYHGKLFAIDAHFERMKRGLSELKIHLPDIEVLKDVAVQLIQDNHLSNGDAIVYLQITRGIAPRRHAFPDEKIPPTTYAYASPFQPPHEQWQVGIKGVLVPDIRWTRCDIKAISLLPNVLANQHAKENDAYEAIFVRDGAITEGSHTNFCAVFEGQLVTHPQSHYILPGITRNVVLNLCGDLAIPVVELPVLQKQLRRADELMLVGTTSEIMPVVQIDDWRVGNGQPGPITRRLQQALREITL